MRLEKKSPCKVNLLLNILGKRADGFHELETVMQPVNFCDELTFERGGNGIQLTCSDPTAGGLEKSRSPRRGEFFVGGENLRRRENPFGEKNPAGRRDSAAAAATPRRRCSR